MASLQTRSSIAISSTAQRRFTPCLPRAPCTTVQPSLPPQVPEAVTLPSASSRQQRAGRKLIAQATYHGSVVASPNMKFGVVVAKFNSLVTKGLLEGAMEAFEAHGVAAENVDIAWVPGSFEVPVVAKNMAKSGKYSAVVCIGAVIQGATSHYDAVVSAVTGGVLSASTDTGVPVIFGVLTTDTLEQALDRTGGKIGNKGGEAAITAVEMATLLDKLKTDKCI